MKSDVKDGFFIEKCKLAFFPMVALLSHLILSSAAVVEEMDVCRSLFLVEPKLHRADFACIYCRYAWTLRRLGQQGITSRYRATCMATASYLVGHVQDTIACWPFGLSLHTLPSQWLILCPTSIC